MITNLAWSAANLDQAFISLRRFSNRSPRRYAAPTPSPIARPLVVSAAERQFKLLRLAHLGHRRRADRPSRLPRGLPTDGITPEQFLMAEEMRYLFEIIGG